VALLFVVLQLSMLGSALLFGLLLTDFSQMRLIQVIQGAAVVTIVLNVVALWKQELWDPSAAEMRRERGPASRGRSSCRHLACLHQGRALQAPADRAWPRHRRLHDAGDPA
jgi:hypothetical protein